MSLDTDPPIDVYPALLLAFTRLMVRKMWTNVARARIAPTVQVEDVETAAFVFRVFDHKVPEEVEAEVRHKVASDIRRSKEKRVTVTAVPQPSIRHARRA